MNTTKLRVTLDKVVPFTSARATFSQMLDEIAKKDYLVIARRYDPAAVVVSPEYFAKLLEAYESVEREKDLRNAQKEVAEEFGDYLRKQGKNPLTVSEKEIKKLLLK